MNYFIYYSIILMCHGGLLNLHVWFGSFTLNIRPDTIPKRFILFLFYFMPFHYFADSICIRYYLFGASFFFFFFSRLIFRPERKLPVIPASHKCLFGCVKSILCVYCCIFSLLQVIHIMTQSLWVSFMMKSIPTGLLWMGFLVILKDQHLEN